VMTHPDWRKKGLFSALDRACMQETARQGWPIVFDENVLEPKKTVKVEFVNDKGVDTQEVVVGAHETKDVTCTAH